MAIDMGDRRRSARPATDRPGRPATPSPVRAALFEAVVGQPKAVAQLTAAARRPVHAYLLHGPTGSGKRAGARGLAAALLVSAGRVREVQHLSEGPGRDPPRSGRGGAHRCRRRRRGGPVHRDQGPTPPAGGVPPGPGGHGCPSGRTGRSRAAEDGGGATSVHGVHPGGRRRSASLATIASRCVKVAFDPVPDGVVIDWLVARGVDPVHAESVGRASGGRLDRALLLVSDPGFVARQDQWRSVPSRLDGTGAVAAVSPANCWRRSMRAWPRCASSTTQELAALAEQAELMGAKGVQGRKQIEDRHKREERRWRTEELRFGLALLAEMFRDRLVAVAESDPRRTRPVVPARAAGPSRHVDGHRPRPPRLWIATPTSRC